MYVVVQYSGKRDDLTHCFLSQFINYKKLKLTIVKLYKKLGVVFSFFVCCI